ncbi:MAG: patatin [Flavobacterium sp. BFFFF2]|nr:MAG: patatin [Flavobacterium sp. BFFFF2]
MSISVPRSWRIQTTAPTIWPFVLFIGVFMLAQVGLAQDQPLPKKLKVGLILSGGGAKGLAHIGVLSELERQGIKVDMIGGTSMGAIIGGLYASGYNARQIDSIFRAADAEAIIKDKLPRTSKNFYEKRNQERYALSLPFSNFKISVPIALSKGLYNYNLLVKLLYHVKHISHFDQLPIPFFCVATDIEQGRSVAFREGYLPEAILASSAFPSLYSPVEIDGKFLIDGGITDNFPAEEMRRMGADVIIGVDVQDDLKTRIDLQDASKILMQVTNVQMMEKMIEKKKQTDIYIRPDISKYSVISFDKIDDIIQKGIDASQTPVVNAQLVALRNKREIYHKPAGPAPAKHLFVESILTNEVPGYTRSYVLGKLRFRQGERITFDDLQQGITNLDASQSFSSLMCRVVPCSDGKDQLLLTLRENPNHMNVKLGLHFDQLYKSAILVNLTRKKNMFKNDVVSFDAGIGDNLRYELEYYIDNGFYWSFGVKSRYNTFNRNVQTDFTGGKLFSQYSLSSMNITYQDFTNQAYIQTIFANRFLLGGGIEYKQLKIKSETLESVAPTFEDSNYISVFASMKYDSLNDLYFPKKGMFFQGDIQSYLLSSNFTGNFNRFSIAKLEYKFAHSFNKTFSAQFHAEGGVPIGNRSVSFLDFVFGGYGFQPINNIKPFYGYDFLSFGANSYLKTTFLVDCELYKKHHLNVGTNFANAENNLFNNGTAFQKPSYTGYALGYGFESVIGPCEFKYTWSPEVGRTTVFFSVGFWF